MSFQLPDLPYQKSALEPHLSKATLEVHHDKHHNKYVNTLNELIEGSEFEGKTLVEILHATVKDSSKAKLFNQAAQVWNHTFYWNSMKPAGGGYPGGKLSEAIEKDFGSFTTLTDEFKQAAATQFGSGWAWLSVDGNGKLQVEKTSNADTPVAHGRKPLLTIDVWEHAYYLDYQNRRPDYIQTFLDHLVNWEFAEKNFEG